MKFVVQEANREYEFLLNEGLCIVGRHLSCDLPLASEKVSRRHMSCRVSKSEVRIEDLGSRNGIYVGGVRVKAATLKDGDRLRVGDVNLIFDAGPVLAERLPAEAKAPAAKVKAREDSISLEDEEQTPMDESLLPEKVQGPRALLVEREGKWYAVDPVSGKQVEVVPARRAEPAGKRLLGKGATKLVIGALAAIVLIVLASAVYRSLRPEPEDQMSGGAYAHLLDSALIVLDANEVEKATELIGEARAGLPGKEAGKILAELAALWQPWQQDFFSHWREAEESLRELARYHSSDTCDQFVQKYQERIERELAHYVKFDQAKKDFQAGHYEQACALLEQIPAASVVRKREAEFFSNARARLLEYINEQISSAVARRDWAQATHWARKLSENFPDHNEQARQQLSAFGIYQQHKQELEKAREQLAANAFGEVEKVLAAIPESSPHRAEADRLVRAAEAGKICLEALSLYNSGQAEAAVDALHKDKTDSCVSLEQHIASVIRIHRSATKAEEVKDLIGAQQLWQRLVQAQDAYFGRGHPELPSRGLIRRQDLLNNYYRREAESRIATGETRRRQRAEELVAEGKEYYDKEKYREARKCFERAVLMDPEDEIGSAVLEQMRSRGRMDYWAALNYAKHDAERALRLLRRACELLPPDDKYYPLATDKKRELEEQARESE